MGGGLAVALVALSPVVAHVVGQPRLLPLLAVLALNLPLRSLGLTHYTLAQRDLEFRERTIAELVEVVVRAAVGIGMALAGFGAWSLVGGYLSGTLGWTCVLWAQVRWRPKLRIRRRDLSPLMRFGGGVTTVGLIGMTMGYADNLLVGAVLGPTALGIYSVAYRLPETLIVDVIAAVGLVLFPAFSMCERGALRSAALAATRYVALVALPIVVILLTLADPLVFVLFGPRWHAAARVIQVLSIGFAGWPLGQVAGNAYLATRRVDVMIKLAVPQGILLVALIAVFVHDGIVAVAICQTAVRVVFVAIGIYVSTRILHFRRAELWRAVRPPLLAASAMGAGIVVLSQFVHAPGPRVVAGCLVGGAIYAAVAWLLAADVVKELSRLTRGAWSTPRLSTLAAPEDAPAKSSA
jgi:PST family polysaccharide transporter